MHDTLDAALTVLCREIAYDLIVLPSATPANTIRIHSLASVFFLNELPYSDSSPRYHTTLTAEFTLDLRDRILLSGFRQICNQ